MITRERLGYMPGTMDLAYLSQDLEELDVAVQRGAHGFGPELLEKCSECEVEARRLGIPDVIAQTLIQRSRILIANKRDAEAISVLCEGERELGNLRQHDLKVRIYAGLADAHAGLAEWKEVSEVCGAGIRIVETCRYDVSGQYLQSAYLRSRIGLYSRGVEAAYETGQYRLMLERAELSKCRSVLRYRSSFSSPGPVAEKTERAFRTICEQIDAARAKGLDAAKIAPLLSRRRTWWELLLIERGRAVRETELANFDLEATQALLEADEAILYYYWVDHNRLLIALIDRRWFNAHLIQTEQRDALDQFCQGILQRLNVDMPGFRQYLDRLDDFAPLLLPESIRMQLDTARKLLISPHQALHALPFHALPWDASGQYLIERFAVTYVPNLRSLSMSYDAPRRHSQLALGIGEYRIAGRNLNPLPEAEEEVCELERLWRERGIDCVCLKGATASRSRLSELERDGALSRFTRLHIATHGQNVNSDTPMESCLFLYDSLLEGLEIANWRLGAELVMLSACSSGQRPFFGRGMAELPGDDLFGLQAAFFTAGARRVIGSLWPVDSAAAREIMAALHRHLAASQSPERALRSAILDYLQSARLLTRKRFYWAPFFVSAVGRARGTSQACRMNGGSND